MNPRRTTDPREVCDHRGPEFPVDWNAAFGATAPPVSRKERRRLEREERRRKKD